jgi:hypothetical protein
MNQSRHTRLFTESSDQPDRSPARSKHESRQEGTEEHITMQRNPQTHQKASTFSRALLFGVMGLGNQLSGCGGWI